MQEETVSKNFIEQEIDKDLAEGVYTLSLIHIFPDALHVPVKVADRRECPAGGSGRWSGAGRDCSLR